jgi:hypothetical protein
VDVWRPRETGTQIAGSKLARRVSTVFLGVYRNFFRLLVSDTSDWFLSQRQLVFFGSAGDSTAVHKKSCAALFLEL